MKKNGAALLMTLLIISGVAAFAFTTARSIVSSLSLTTKSTDAKAAEEAANGGIEWGVLTFKERGQPYPVGNTTYYTVGIDCYLDFSNNQCLSEEPESSTTYAHITGIKYIEIVPPITRTSGWVKSTGVSGKANRTLKANIDNTGKVVLGDDTSDVCPAAGSTAVALAGSDSGGIWGGGRIIARGSDGTLYSVYHRKASTASGIPSNLFLGKSTDNGKTWTEQSQITNVVYPQSVYNEKIVVDYNNDLHLFWTGVSGISYCKYSTTTNTCSATTTLYNQISSFPSPAIDSNNNLHLVFTAVSNGGGGQSDVYYCKVVNGVCDNPKSIYHSSGTRFPSVQSTMLAIDRNNEIHVVWDDERAENRTSEIYYLRTNGGTWQEVQQVTNLPNQQIDPAIALDSQNKVHIAWEASLAPRDSNDPPRFIYQIAYCQYPGTGLCPDIKRVTNTSEVYTEGTTSFVDDQLYPDIALDQEDNVQIAWSTRIRGIVHCQFEGQVCNNPIVMENLPKSATQQYVFFVSSLWANFPVINGVRTNVLAKGWAGIWINAYVNATSLNKARLVFGNACMVTNK